jgi:hypothetical protein
MGFFFALVQHILPLSLQWPIVQLFPAARAGSPVLRLSFIDVYEFIAPKVKTMALISFKLPCRSVPLTPG